MPRGSEIVPIAGHFRQSIEANCPVGGANTLGFERPQISILLSALQPHRTGYLPTIQLIGAIWRYKGKSDEQGLYALVKRQRSTVELTPHSPQ